MDEGVPVLGYLHWSLLDNFGWIFGYKYRYGMVAVDRTTFQRTP
jgi:beta-glucosidase